MASVSNPGVTNTIEYAEHLSRFDFASLLLTATAVIVAGIGVLLIFGGIFAFLNIKRSAEEEAEKVAEKHSREVAERVANEYMQLNLPSIVQEYMDLVRNSVARSAADEIALAQDEDDHENN